MYAFVINDKDNHILTRWFRGKKQCQTWLDEQLELSRIVYSDNEFDFGILKDKDFEMKYPKIYAINIMGTRRLGDKLKERINNVNSMPKTPDNMISIFDIYGDKRE